MTDHQKILPCTDLKNISKGGGQLFEFANESEAYFGNLKKFEFAGGIDPPDPPPFLDLCMCYGILI